MKKTAAWLVRHALEQIGIRYTFGIPGVHNIELYDELRESEQVLPLLVTHEGGASFMADAVSRLSDQVGVLVVVPAAGLTHAMSGVETVNVGPAGSESHNGPVCALMITVWPQMMSASYPEIRAWIR